MQRFHRDADETKEWIEGKNQALNTDNLGHDLAAWLATEHRETPERGLYGQPKLYAAQARGL